MKRLVISLIVIGILYVAGAAGYKQLSTPRNRVVASAYQTAPLRRGNIKVVVNSTGTVQPALSAQVVAPLRGESKMSM